MQKRGQSSVEFSVLISFMFFAFIIFFAIIGWRLSEITRDNEKMLLDDLGEYIQNEISLAASSGEGYERSFDIPKTLAGKKYNVEIMPLLGEGWGVNYSQLVLDFNDTRGINSYMGVLPLRVKGIIDPSVNRTVVIRNTYKGIIINNVEDYCVYNADGTICDDGLYCTEDDTCAGGVCVGLEKDCSDNNLPEIATCNYNPDDNPFTWDVKAGFTSTCDEVQRKCTSSEYSFTHSCDVENCGAECESDSDCNDGNPLTTDSCVECSCQHYTGPYCGDGTINQPEEECDDGPSNGVVCTPAYDSSCNYCTDTCQVQTLDGNYCGDGILDASYEECESDSDCGIMGCNLETCECDTPVVEQCIINRVCNSPEENCYNCPGDCPCPFGICCPDGTCSSSPCSVDI